jgi:hypothetical protein
MSADVPLPAIAGQPFFSLPLDARRLVNTYHRPIEISEIRFVVTGQQSLVGNVSQLTGGSSVLGAILGVRLHAGRDRLTGDDPVPIWMLGPPIQGNSTEAAYATNGEREITSNAFAAPDPATAVVDTYHYRWRFPKPMILPAGQAIAGTVEMIDLGFAGPTVVNGQVTVAVVGRYLPQGSLPRTRSVPYATAYQYRRVGGVDESQHPQRVFQNPFDRPLQVQHFLGRLTGLFAGATPVVFDASHTGAVLATGASSIQNRNGTLTMRFNAPDGYDSDNPVPFDRMFDTQRRVWEAPHALDPGQLWRFSVVAYPTPSNSTARPVISLIGHREEAL